MLHKMYLYDLYGVTAKNKKKLKEISLILFYI